MSHGVFLQIYSVYGSNKYDKDGASHCCDFEDKKLTYVSVETQNCCLGLGNGVCTPTEGGDRLDERHDD